MIPKFRAWLKREKKMVDVKKLTFVEGKVRCVFYRTGTEDHDSDILSSACYEGVTFKLMQSTGLKDINDKEIYEGDVIKVSNGLCDIDEENPFVVVKWDEEAGGYTMKDFTGEFDTLNIGWQIADKLVRVEVVGNIYENPELLEEAEKCSHSS